MKLFEIIIGNKTYEFVNSINYNGKDYVAYQDNDNIYISEFVINDNNVDFKDIDEDTLKEVKEALSL